MKIFQQTLFFLLLIAQLCFSQGFWTKWSKMPYMPENRFAHTVDEINGKIYVVGGGDYEGGLFPATALIYDRSTGMWDTIPLYNNILRACHNSCVVNGKLYVVGGNNGIKTVSTMEVLDPITNQWDSIASMPTDRGLAASAVVDDTIYVIGGLRGYLNALDYTGLDTVEAYNINTGQWTLKAHMPTKRWGCTATAFNGKIYVFGGRSFGVPYSSIEVYDPQTDKWDTTTVFPLIPTARYCLTSSLLDSNIFVIGGWYQSGAGPLYDAVEVYNPLSNTWSTDTPLPAKLAVLACTVFDDKIYVFGGARTTHPNYGTSAIYEYSDKDIFALNPALDKGYAGLNIDSVLLVTRFKNINQHQFTPHLIYSDLDSTQIDSVSLFDDGVHGDSLANDGLYGAFIPPQQAEDFFTLSISTIDNQTNKYYNTPDRCRFTTAGPVRLDSIYVQDQSTYFYVKPLLKNQSASITITNASVRLICNDPWVTSISPDTRDLPDIPPGGVVGPLVMFGVVIDTSIFPDYFNFKVEVLVEGWGPFWTDSMRYPPIAAISINPAELDFGEVAIDSSETKTFTITNSGDEDLIVSDISSSEPVFTVNITSAVISPDSSQEVEVTFTPTGAITVTGKIEITHNAAGSPDSVVVRGNGVTGIEEKSKPLTFSLEQNYPNPFNPNTVIKFSIPKENKVIMKLYNLLGEEVATLLNEVKVAGYYRIEFNAANLPSGVYFYQLKAVDPSSGSGQVFIQTKKMILLK